MFLDPTILDVRTDFGHPRYIKYSPSYCSTVLTWEIHHLQLKESWLIHCINNGETDENKDKYQPWGIAAK